MKDTFTFTESNLAELLNSPISRFEKDRKLCGRCDNYSSVKHAGLLCDKCGGAMVSVKEWTVFNLLNRVKPIPSRGEQWLAVFVAGYLNKTTGLDWFECYQWAVKREIHAANIELLRTYKVNLNPK
jgi:hypothetical protein